MAALPIQEIVSG